MPDYQDAMDQMIRQIQAHGFSNPTVLDAMRQIWRHQFVPEPYRGSDNYANSPCDIGHGQTISQPYIVAHMLGLLDLEPGEKVLEIGAGSGYQAAVLAQLGADVYSIDVVPDLAEHAAIALAAAGLDVHVSCRDGHDGWPEFAPYDAIIAACAPTEMPSGLLSQLADGGRLIMPVGKDDQALEVYRKTRGQITKSVDCKVRFVPMV
jgi:protein-L-isoaspartate(D-aspartate) O-methyltransferase